MNLFPNMTVALSERAEEELPVYREWAYDMEHNRFLTRNGQYYLVEKNDAIKIWIYKAAKTARYRYPAYSRKYGNEYEQLIGESSDREILENEIERLTKEMLLVNPYIEAVDDFLFRHEGARIIVFYTVTTVYGELEMEGEIDG